MSLPNKLQIPDLYIEEMQKYIQISNNPLRTTSGQATYQNPRTLASYTTVGSAYDNQGEQGLGLLLYNVSPNLKQYIFDNTTYDAMKTTIESLDIKSDTLETDLNIVRTAVLDTGTVNNIIVDTAGTFDLTRNGNILTVIPLFTNTSATVNISADAQTNKLIKKANDSGTFVAVEVGDIKKNVPIQLVLDSVNDFFILAPKGGSNIKTIQRGSVVVGSTSTNVTISTVDTDKAIVKLSFTPTSTNDPSESLVRGKITTSTNLQLLKNSAASSTTTVYWEIVEFNNIKTLQKGEVNLSTTQSNNITISSVNLNKTIVFDSFTTNRSTTTDNMLYSFEKCALTTTTNLNILRGGILNSSTHNYQILEFN